METRATKEAFDMLIPQFKSELCESCRDEAELFDIGREIRGYVNVKASYSICLSCLKELKPVSDMVAQLKHEFENKLYYRAYDKINYKN